MAMIADILLAAGALGAALYCYVLARRLRRFTDLETGVGGAVAVLSAQVDDLVMAQKSAGESAQTLAAQTGKADDAAKRIELLVASLHDLPPEPQRQAPISPFFERRQPKLEDA